jgi:hypothetical protein
MPNTGAGGGQQAALVSPWLAVFAVAVACTALMGVALRRTARRGDGVPMD